MLKAIKKNSRIEIKEVDLFEGINIKTCYIFKVYLRLSYTYLKTYYKKITLVTYTAAIIFYPCKK